MVTESETMTEKEEKDRWGDRQGEGDTVKET